ncbi:MAG: hypothetical protein QM401_07250 [Bacillota bacterium]|nr:hypothetical protein [Bacillota bacterium]
MIIGVDFDKTIAVTEYPEIIRPKFMAFRMLKHLKRNGHTLILWTCRQGPHLEQAIRFCKTQGIEFSHHNANAAERIQQYGGDCRKLSCDLLIDDTAGFVFWPWVMVRVLVKEWQLKRGAKLETRRSVT